MPEFVFHEPLPEKPKLAFNTPFVIEHLYPPFAMSESLDLHPAAARILDDVRTLFSIILQLTAPPSPGELHKVQHTAEMIYGRLESMPDLCPDAPRTPFAPPTVTTAPSEASFPASLPHRHRPPRGQVRLLPASPSQSSTAQTSLPLPPCLSRSLTTRPTSPCATKPTTSTRQISSTPPSARQPSSTLERRQPVLR